MYGVKSGHPLPGAADEERCDYIDWAMPATLTWRLLEERLTLRIAQALTE